MIVPSDPWVIIISPIYFDSFNMSINCTVYIFLYVYSELSNFHSNYHNCIVYILINSVFFNILLQKYVQSYSYTNYVFILRTGNV